MFAKKESYSLEQLPCKSFLKVEDCNRDGERNVLPNRRMNQICTAFLTLFYLTLQSISSLLIAVIVKELFYISICQLSLIQFAGIFAISLPVAIIRNEHAFGVKDNWLLLTLRGLLVATGLFLHMASFRYLQLVEVFIVRSTFPFFTAILARIILKEHFGNVLIVTLFITFGGVLLSLKLPEKFASNTRNHFDIYFALGLIMSLGSVLCLALSAVASRKLKNVHFSILLLYVGFLGVLENGVLNATVYPLVLINCGWDQIMCLLLGILGFSANGFLAIAYQFESAGLVTVQKSSLDVLVSAIFQILFYAQYPDVYVVSGACLVIASLTVIGIKNWVQLMPDSSKTRHNLKRILA